MAGSRTSRIVSAAAAVAFAVTAVLAVGPANAAPTKKPQPTSTITKLPAQVKLLPGQSVNVTLETNVTTGYSWSAKVVGKAGTVTVSDGKYTAPNTTLVGAPGTTTWTITAVKKGTAVVRFLTTPPGSTTAQNVGKVTVIVQKK